MNIITKDDMNEIVRKGEDQLILFYKKNHAPSTLFLDVFQSVDSLIGKNFSCYIVDVDAEPIVAEVFSVTDAPEVVSMRNTKILKRSNNILYSNQILDLLK